MSSVPEWSHLRSAVGQTLVVPRTRTVMTEELRCVWTNDKKSFAGKPALSVTHNWSVHTEAEEFLDG